MAGYSIGYDEEQPIQPVKKSKGFGLFRKKKSSDDDYYFDEEDEEIVMEEELLSILYEEENDYDGVYQKLAKWGAIVFTIFLFVLCAAYIISVKIFDTNNGAKSSRELATSVAGALDDFNYSKIEKYVPGSMRSDGFISDSDNFAEFRVLDFENGYVLQKVIIDEDLAYNDLDALQKGMLSVYNKHLSILDARVVKMRLEFATTQGDLVTFGCNVIPIRVGNKWYFYTGKMVELDGETLDLIVLPETEDTSFGDSNLEEETEIAFTRPMTAADAGIDEEALFENTEETSAEALEFYAEAKADLQKGKCVINGVKHEMPDTFASFNDLFVLDESALTKLRTVMLMPDETISNLPMKLLGEGHENTPFFVTIANLSSDNIDLHDGNITTLYIGKKEDGETPSVVLPGGVTFGTYQRDVLRMYSSLSLSSDESYKGKLADTVYEISLSNKSNKLLLGFKENKLVEIQWQYIDMTSYRHIS